MRALRLTLVALWWRRWLSLAVLVVAVVTTSAAALGPFYARAAGDSVLRDTLASAPAVRSGAELSLTGSLGNANPKAIFTTLPGGRPPASYATAVSTSEIDATTLLRHGDREGRRVSARLAARDGVCDQLRLAAGSCPAAAGEVMVSTRTARAYGWQVGQQVGGFVPNVNPPPAPPLALPTFTITGIYRPANAGAPYWFGHNFFDAHPYVGPGFAPDTIDTVFVSAATVGQLPPDAPASALVDLPLRPGPVHVSNVPRLRADLATVQAAGSLSVAGSSTSYQSGAASTVTVVTGLGDLLAEVARNQSLLNIAVLAVTLQLAVLAWFVLYLLIATTTEARAGEVALAKLHGLSPRATITFGLLEPVLLLLIATPLGLVAADLVTATMAHTLLAAGTAVELRQPPVYGALGALAGGLIAAALAGRQAIVRPVLAQWERSGGDQAGRRAGTFFDGLVVALAAAGIVQLVIGGTHGGGRSDVVALVAPAMLTLALALLAVRLLPRLCQPVLRRTRATDRLPAFLAYRQLVRRPSVLRLVILLALATGLATFAVDASAIAARNRAERARYDVGADRVLDVSAASPQVLLDTVRRLDPSGRQAMAVLVNTPFSSTTDRTGTLLAVDSPRLAAVANWRADLAGEPATQVGAALHPSVPAPVRVRAGTLRLIVRTSSLRASVPITVTADIAGAAGTGTVPMGRLHAGRGLYTGTVPACPHGCTLTGVELGQPLGEFTTIAGTAVVESVAGPGGPYDARLSTSGVWQAKPAGDGRSQVVPGPDGLAYTFRSDSGDPPGVLVRDVPEPLPAVFAAGTAGAKPPAQLRGLDGTMVPASTVAVADGIPGLGSTGTLVDLEYALRSGDQPSGDPQVWLSAAAPANFAARLAGAGVDITGSHTAAQRRTELNRSGPALALLLFLLVAAAAAVIAAGATAVTIYLGARRRTFEAAAMLAVGVRPRQLARAATGEHLLLLVTGVGIGVVGGMVGATLAMPTVPEFADNATIPRLLLTPVLPPLVALVVVLVVAVGLTVALAARLVVRAALPSRLREAAP